jgi:hypothetical protein
MSQNHIGYKLSFCKKLSDVDNVVKGVSFTYRSLGHFDGIFIDKIYKIEEFGETCAELAKSRENKEIAHEKKRVLAHCEKQILNLIIEKDSKYIIEDKTKPIIAVTLLNCVASKLNCKASGCPKEKCDIRESLMDKNNKIIEEGVLYETFTPLSIESMVIIWKSDRIENIIKSISNLRNNSCFKYVVNIYSIISIDSTIKGKCAAEDINAYIKIQAAPTSNFNKIRESLCLFLNNNTKTSDGKDNVDKVCTDEKVCVGKFDLTFQISIKEITLENYMILYDKVLDTSVEDVKNLGILSTETTLVYPLGLDTGEYKKPDGLKKTTWKTWEKGFEDKWKIKENQVKIKKRFPTLYKFSGMLGGRAHRISHAVSSYKYFSGFWEFISNFTIAIPEYIISDMKNQDKNVVQIDHELRSLISGIDDVFSISFHDFEQSQKDALCVHSAGKLMVAYSNFAEFLGYPILKELSQYTKENVHFSIVSSIIETTQITEIPITTNQIEKSFFTIQMPFSNIYKFNAAIFKIAHEIGHLNYLSDEIIPNFAEQCYGKLVKRNLKFLNPKVKEVLFPKIKRFYGEFAADYYAVKVLGIDTIGTTVGIGDKTLVINQIKDVFNNERSGDDLETDDEYRFDGIRSILEIDPKIKYDEKDIPDLVINFVEGVSAENKIYKTFFDISSEVVPDITEELNLEKNSGDILRIVFFLIRITVSVVKLFVKLIVKLLTYVQDPDKFITNNSELCKHIIPIFALEYLLKNNKNIKNTRDTLENSGLDQKKKDFFKSFKEGFFKHIPPDKNKRKNIEPLPDKIDPLYDFILAFTERSEI